MTQGQGGSLYLSCIELSSTTLCQSPGALNVQVHPVDALTLEQDVVSQDFTHAVW